MPPPTISFTGDVPARYDHYRGPSFERFAEDLTTRTANRPIASALEIACGTGRVTRLLRRALPSTSSLVATDISPDMLSFAQNALAQESVEWRIVDAQSLPFPDASFDLVICQFGFMFVADKPKAMREAHRVLASGGLLLFNTWDSLEASPIAALRTSVIEDYFGSRLPISDVAHSMSREDDLRLLVEAAGFSDVAVERVTKYETGESPEEAARSAIFGGPILNHIQSIDPNAVEKIVAILAGKIETAYGPRPRAEMNAWVTEGWKR